MWRRATEAGRADGLVLATSPQSAGCLHEQQALQEMMRCCANWRAKVSVLEQRSVGADGAAEDTDASSNGDGGDGDGGAFNLNTFLRWSHVDNEREGVGAMRFDGDASGSGWRAGDFSGHCSGLSPLRRALCSAVLLGAVVR